MNKEKECKGKGQAGDDCILQDLFWFDKDYEFKDSNFRILPAPQRIAAISLHCCS